ncbi:hypothetical protein DYY67_2009 [Candidatus Nitrosotalea sp. TS]|uniref:TFIIB-type zinc ribbon-containing protein n=1 Tax=Candidatus Nitrosotalea sp. TS TaxID=2341020 RepID=UPI001408D9D0|nr:TFIIB-type zinc ribbon-containing protein [Candidatus Nitrosotalea sp. TS]NHI02327.1 hypothetical protein [Candidatus Nitrosotalea sp. TS]
MTFFDPDTICPGCGIDKMIEDPANRELGCRRCGLVLPLTETEPVHASENKPLNVTVYRLGSDRRSTFSSVDYAKNRIDSRVRSDLLVASKYDREQAEHEQAAVSHITELYDTVTYPTYDDGLKKGDLQILRRRAKNMTEATGQRQAELDLLKIIRRFLRVKLAKYPELKKYFKLDLLHVKIRHRREGPQNISGRGNQIGKNRKEGRIGHCNLCRVEIPNYKAKRHHREYHSSVPYHQYIDKRKQYVRRSARLEDAIVDCSAAKGEELESQERGPCIHCDIPNAIIKRYPRIEVAKKERIDIVSRIVARHKDNCTGRWRACILQQRKIGQKKV